MSRITGLPLTLAALAACLAGQAAEGLGDDLIPVPCRVLVDHGRAGAGVAEPGHQLLERCARGSGESSPGVPEIMEMEARHACRRAGLIPDGPKVGAAQRSALRADEDQTAFPRRGTIIGAAPGELTRESLDQLGTGTLRSGRWCMPAATPSWLRS
jgi:hypothetical protein